MKDIETLESLFDNKILAILAVLVNDMTGGLYLREISKYTSVSDASSFRIIKKLISLEIVEQVRIKKLKLYKFKHTERSDFLYKILKKDVQVIEMFVNETKVLHGVQAVLLHGKQGNQRANVLIIGSDVDNAKIKEICGNIKEKYKFIISPLVLTAEQFKQMSSMGLYSGKEKVLFKRG